MNFFLVPQNYCPRNITEASTTLEIGPRVALKTGLKKSVTEFSSVIRYTDFKYLQKYI
jgi:Holliday junction resolvasome RuvABC DNA-binding subunit